MQPELEILQDIKAAFLAAFSVELRVHYGDEIAVKEAADNIQPATPFDYWLVPDENDKQDDLAASTEGEIQTFTATHRRCLVSPFRPERQPHDDARQHKPRSLVLRTGAHDFVYE